MKQGIFILLLTMIGCSAAVAQYAPQQGVVGSTAISASDPSFTLWASGCSLHRGYIDIDSPALGYTSNGDSSNALGAPDHSTVSLGDSGVADMTFSAIINNGPGPDFAVFENGFSNPANDSQAFLELAFVEVSSDGTHYTRFPAQSLTQTTVQINGSGDYMYANLVNNLAGKYIGGYGTPFDLNELAGSTDLDVDHITHIRVVDVIGNIHAHSSHDSSGRIINDPYPTNFPSGGFDLDAVGIINHGTITAVNSVVHNNAFTVYPNPATDKMYINNTTNEGVIATLSTVTGSVLQQFSLTGNRTELSISSYPAGLYYLALQDANGTKWVEKIIKR